MAKKFLLHDIFIFGYILIFGFMIEGACEFSNIDSRLYNQAVDVYIEVGFNKNIVNELNKKFGNMWYEALEARKNFLDCRLREVKKTILLKRAAFVAGLGTMGLSYYGKNQLMPLGETIAGLALPIGSLGASPGIALIMLPFEIFVKGAAYANAGAYVLLSSLMAGGFSTSYAAFFMKVSTQGIEKELLLVNTILEKIKLLRNAK